ncbi:glycosyltransferase [Limosilactobacillus fermentum]
MSNDEFPAFSVLMSVYKKEKPAFLDKALESIEDQTVKPNQIVAVVDGPIGSELDLLLKQLELFLQVMEQDNMDERDHIPFTVLMAVYKGDKAAFLEKTFESILNQTVLPNEIVLVEDGKVSVEIQNVIGKFQKNFDGKFTLLKLKKNSGLGHALNFGSKYVTTEWIARVDSDDINALNRFQLELDAINKYPDVSLIGGQIDEFQNHLDQTVGSRIVPTTHGQIVNFLKYRNPFNHPTVMVKKAALEDSGNYLSFGNLEDYYLWARMIVNKYKTVNLPEILVHMRIGNGMYARRGKVSNVKYVIKLHNYLFKNNLCTIYELAYGIFIGVSNLVMPKMLRKNIYQKVLHKPKNNRIMREK